MKNQKKVISILLLIAMLSGMLAVPAQAADETLTATTTTSEGVTVNWSYKLQDNNIVNLKCTNASDISGKIEIPSTINEKKVLSLENGCLYNAKEITDIIVPISVKDIGYEAFQNCTCLKNVNLGSIQTLGFSSFKGCTALESITIPKTLKSTTGIIFSGCTNLKNIILEDGLTEVPSNLCAETNITSIDIPNSVKDIDYEAFENCTSLKNVNLGSIQTLGFDSFKGCTALESITIPKTLKSTTGIIFSECTNLKNIILEDGLKVVPSSLCEKTNITSIDIPSSVEKIEESAFKDCNNLKKITILDNVKFMGWYSSSKDKDTVFQNHNEDLTIYCYEGSLAANYAIDTKIKYVYLPKENNSNVTNGETNSGTGSGTNNGGNSGTTNKPSTSNDPTTAKTELPKTGESIAIFGVIAVLVAGGVFYFVKVRKYSDIK